MASDELAISVKEASKWHVTDLEKKLESTQPILCQWEARLDEVQQSQHRRLCNPAEQ